MKVQVEPAAAPLYGGWSGDLIFCIQLLLNDPLCHRISITNFVGNKYSFLNRYQKWFLIEKDRKDWRLSYRHLIF